MDIENNNYTKKYLKYKKKYLELKKKQEGGFIETLIYASLGVGSVLAKRFLQCPRIENNIRDVDTGKIEKIGKKGIIDKIRRALNYHKIKDHPKFKPILDKLDNFEGPKNIDDSKFIESPITLKELKNTLQSMVITTDSISGAIKDAGRLAINASGFTNAKVSRQQKIDEIISFLDCGCNERGVTLSGLAAQGAQTVSSYAGYSWGGKVDLRCLSGLVKNHPIPSKSDEKDFFNKVEIIDVEEFQQAENEDEDPETRELNCNADVIQDFQFIDNNNAIITLNFPEGKNCLKKKIKSLNEYPEDYKEEQIQNSDESLKDNKEEQNQQLDKSLKENKEEKKTSFWGFGKK